MIYVDSSVILACLLGQHAPLPPSWFSQPLVASRLLEVETHITVRRLGRPDVTPLVHALIQHIDLYEVDRAVCDLARQEHDLRSLDAIHLATAEVLRREVGLKDLATHDKELMNAAGRRGFHAYAPTA